MSKSEEKYLNMAIKTQQTTWFEAFSILTLLVSVFSLFGLAGLESQRQATEVRLASLPTPVTRQAASILDYDISDIRTGRSDVPRLFLVTMPENYFEIETISERKREFLRILLPLVLLANEEIRAERQHLLEILALRETGRELPASAEGWLNALMVKYEVNRGDIEDLLHRVDVVSPAVTLSQAIEETGWGRSRFIKQGNAIFGERTWSRGAGIVPAERPEGRRYEVRQFGSLLESVQAYALNLNTHPAYTEFRALRAELRVAGLHRPAELAETLLAYSERGVDYIRAIRQVIRDNQLHQFETAKLTNVVSRTISDEPAFEGL